MKNLLQLLLNLYSWFSLSFISFFGILWYGKLPKVSFYHWTKNGSLYETKDIYNDVNCQVKKVEDVPTNIKHRIIDEYIDGLFENERFKANIVGMDIPYFDGKEITGTTGIYSILEEVKLKMYKDG